MALFNGNNDFVVVLGGGGGSSVELDTTLTKEGYAADAKAAGDRITAVEKTIADMTYEPIKINSFSANPSTAEKGSTVSSIKFSWATNKTPKALTFDGATIDATLTSKTVTGTFTESEGFTLVATGENGETSTKSASITFYNRVYYGVVAKPTEYNSAFILGLAKNPFSSNGIVSSFDVNAADGQYIYYCLPKDMGKRTFTVGVLSGGFEEPITISFTNETGKHTEDYYIYRSTNAGLGETTVKVS